MATPCEHWYQYKILCLLKLLFQGRTGEQSVPGGRSTHQSCAVELIGTHDLQGVSGRLSAGRVWESGSLRWREDRICSAG